MIKIEHLEKLSPQQRSTILNRAGVDFSHVENTVRNIIDQIQKRGDSAILELTTKFDGVALNTIQVTKQEIDQAYATIDKNLLNAIKTAAKNIERFHRSHLLKPKKITTTTGVTAWREWRPIEKVGLYIPGGKAIYPSSVLMTAIPARIAGCIEIVVCCPPDKTGSLPTPTLVAADIAGATTICKVGGAQAIAAMAYGTKSVPAVSKIFGAGNTFVTAAKMLCFGKVAIDMPAGPSEILIIADDTATPAFVAADLLAQAEHGTDSASVLITPSKKLAAAVQNEVKKQLKIQERKDLIQQSLDKFSLILITKSLDTAIDFANEYATEHLEIITKNDASVLKKIKHAGSIFLGNFTPVVAGDYASGTNHVLPTAGYAKMFQALSLDSFGCKVQVQKATKAGLKNLQPTIETLAEAEGLYAHKNAITIRFNGK
ncbi:MAG: histidinol dehydrogenase [bacterium]